MPVSNSKVYMQLPVDIVQYISSYLDALSTFRLGLTCAMYRNILLSDIYIIYQNLC